MHPPGSSLALIMQADGEMAARWAGLEYPARLDELATPISSQAVQAADSPEIGHFVQYGPPDDGPPKLI